MIIFVVVWGICYYYGKAPRFVRYAPIALLALSALQAFVGLMNGSEGHFLGGLVGIIVYLGCAVLGWNSKPQVKDENERRYAANEWTDADKEKFKRLTSDHRRRRQAERRRREAFGT
jgi:hypothetical protein